MIRPDPKDVPLRRLLVALDASEPSLAALDAAVSLAARLGSDVTGLIVEDAALVALVLHPAARHVDAASGAPCRADETTMRQELKVLRERARRALDAAAARARVRASFRSTVGRVTAEIVAAAAEADLVCVGRVGWTSPRSRLGSTARALVSSGAVPVLLVREGQRLGGRVAAVYDGTEAGARALSVGARLVRDGGGLLSILVPAADPDALQQLRDAAGDWAKRARLDATTHAIPLPLALGLPLALREAAATVLVVAARTLGEPASAAAPFIEGVRLPVVVVP